MPRGRPKKKIQLENSFEDIQPYDLTPPADLIVEESAFNPDRLIGFKWQHKGCFYSSGTKMICLKIDGKI